MEDFSFFLVTIPPFPFNLSYKNVLGKSKTTLRAADILFKKSESKMVNKKQRPLCRDDSNQSFTECAMRILPEILRNSNIDCLSSFWKGLQKYSNMTLCGMNETQARQVISFSHLT